jgi:hypothetical protein
VLLMDIPAWLQNILLAFLLAGVLAPLTLFLPEELQGPRALVAVVAISLGLVAALRRWLGERRPRQDPPDVRPSR